MSKAKDSYGSAKPDGGADRFCASCGKVATTFREHVKDPEYAARVVASIHGILRACDFDRVPFCDLCADFDDREAKS